MKKRTMKTAALAMSAMLTMGALLTGCSGSTDTATAAADTASGGVPADVQKIIDAGVLKVGCKVDVPNFSLQNTGTGEYEGYETDLAYTIAGEIFGCTAEEAREKDLVEFQGVSAKTRGPLLDNDEVDLIIATFTITDERKESWNFSSSYFTDAVGFLVLKDSGINSMADMDGKVIGVSRSSTSKDGFRAYAEANGLDVEPVFEDFDTYPELAAALASKNIDVFCVDRAILSGYVDDTNVLLDDRFAEQEYGVASKKSNTGLADLVEGVITGLKDSGEMDKMLSQWGLK